jgi:hypothetical protein
MVWVLSDEYEAEKSDPVGGAAERVAYLHQGDWVVL